MRKLLPMMALRVAGSDCECSSLRIETMNASLGIAGGEPAKAILVAIVDRRWWDDYVSILIAAGGGLARLCCGAPRSQLSVVIMLRPQQRRRIFVCGSGALA